MRSLPASHSVLGAGLAALVAQAALAAVALGATGCADRGSEERHLVEMSEQIDHLQVQQDELNRQSLAADVADSHFSSVPPRVPAPLSAPPVVVPVGGDAYVDSESPDTEDPSPRPTIHLVGSPRGTRGDRGDLRGGLDTPGVDDDQGAAPARPSALDPQAKRAYDAALHRVGARQYDQALDDLAAFLVKWPDHPYADNAMFWRGECYFAKGDYLHAEEQFEGVITRFPAGNKAPDALLKLGMSHLKLGNPVKAREAFDRLAQSYPQSDAARRIPPVPVQATTPSGPASEDHR